MTIIVEINDCNQRKQSVINKRGNTTKNMIDLPFPFLEDKVKTIIIREGNTNYSTKINKILSLLSVRNLPADHFQQIPHHRRFATLSPLHHLRHL